MKSRGIENTITQRAADPATFTKRPGPIQADGAEKRRLNHKIGDFPIALRIQALALAEASISYDRIGEITGIEAKLVDKLRKMARERGYDPTESMHLREDYVVDPVKPALGRHKKQKTDEIVPNGVRQAPADTATIPGYVQADTSNLPPGNWNFMAGTQVQPGSALT